MFDLDDDRFADVELRSGFTAFVHDPDCLQPNPFVTGAVGIRLTLRLPAATHVLLHHVGTVAVRGHMTRR